MTKTNTTTPEPDALAVAEPSSPLALIKQVIETVPQADEDPTERMAEFILSQPAERWEELWAGLPNVQDNAGQKVVVHAIRVRPSDYKGTLGVYLIADVTWLPSGIKGLLTCSSQIGMLQLLTLYRDKKLPTKLEIVKKEKATKRGFHPIHFRYLGETDARLGDPGAVVAEQ